MVNIDQEDKQNKTYNGCNTGDYTDDIPAQNKTTRKQKYQGVLSLKCRFSSLFPISPTLPIRENRYVLMANDDSRRGMLINPPTFPSTQKGKSQQ